MRIIKNKLPGIASINELYINLKGQKEINDDVLVRIFNNMLSPGYYKQNTEDKYEKKLLNLYYQTGKSEMILGKYKSFTFEKEKFKLTLEEYTKINAYYSKELRQATKDFMYGVYAGTTSLHSGL